MIHTSFFLGMRRDSDVGRFIRRDPVLQTLSDKVVKEGKAPVLSGNKRV